ncbi:unnamed protein product [Calypogeia fissa]
MECKKQILLDSRLLFLLLVYLISLAIPTYGDRILSSILKTCDHPKLRVEDPSEHFNCSKKVVLELTIDNGKTIKSDTSEIFVTSILEADGTSRDLARPYRVTIYKSDVYVQYPLRYTKTFAPEVDFKYRNGSLGCGLLNKIEYERLHLGEGYCNVCAWKDKLPYWLEGAKTMRRSDLQCAFLPITSISSRWENGSMPCLRQIEKWCPTYEIEDPTMRFTITMMLEELYLEEGLVYMHRKEENNVLELIPLRQNIHVNKRNTLKGTLQTNITRCAQPLTFNDKISSIPIQEEEEITRNYEKWMPSYIISQHQQQNNEGLGGKLGKQRMDVSSNKSVTSFVKLEYKCNKIHYFATRSSGKIVSVTVLSNIEGTPILHVEVTNTGWFSAKFLIQVAKCSIGIDNPRVQFVTLPVPKIISSFFFELHKTDYGVTTHVCHVKLFDSFGEKADSSKITFETMLDWYNKSLKDPNVDLISTRGCVEGYDDISMDITPNNYTPNSYDTILRRRVPNSKLRGTSLAIYENNLATCQPDKFGEERHFQNRIGTNNVVKHKYGTDNIILARNKAITTTLGNNIRNKGKPKFDNGKPKRLGEPPITRPSIGFFNNIIKVANATNASNATNQTAPAAAPCYFYTWLIGSCNASPNANDSANATCGNCGGTPMHSFTCDIKKFCMVPVLEVVALIVLIILIIVFVVIQSESKKVKSGKGFIKGKVQKARGVGKKTAAKKKGPGKPKGKKAGGGATKAKARKKKGAAAKPTANTEKNPQASNN